MSVLFLFPPISPEVFLLSSGHGQICVSPAVSVRVVSGELVHVMAALGERVQAWIHILDFVTKMHLCVLSLCIFNGTVTGLV